MTNSEINEITILQKRQLGYKRIAAITRIPLNAVKAYTSRHPVDPEDVCQFCGKLLQHKEHHRRKNFCSPHCKSKWWNAHPHMLTRHTLNPFVCPVCSESFTDYGKRVYCSRSCYTAARRKAAKADE